MTNARWILVLALVVTVLTTHGTAKVAWCAIFVALLLTNVVHGRRPPG